MMAQLDTAGEALALRRAENSQKEKINNASLYAGSPMYYYCKSCDALAATLPECHISPAPRFCGPCRDLFDQGRLVNTGARWP